MSVVSMDVTRLPGPVEWFINRTNAGDIDSILDTLVAGAVVHHDGHDLDWYALDEFLGSPWYLGGYIHLVPLHHRQDAETEWTVRAAVSGRSADLRAVSGAAFDFRFSLRGEKIAAVRIVASRPQDAS